VETGTPRSQKGDLGHPPSKNLNEQIRFPLVRNERPLWGLRPSFSAHVRWCERRAPLRICGTRTGLRGSSGESRMKFREPTKLHRKSGVWGTRRLVRGWCPLDREQLFCHGLRLESVSASRTMVKPALSNSSNVAAEIIYFASKAVIVSIRAASSSRTFATTGTCSSARFQLSCSMASRTPGSVFTP
jgi:hypothetical protein